LNRFLALVAAVAAVALVVAGCGDSDDSTTDSGASLTKAEFVKQGNAVCAKGNKEIEEGFEEFSEEKNLRQNKEPSKAVLTEASETILIPAVSSQIDELRALGTPEGDEGEVDQLLTNAEEVLEEGEEDPVSLTEEGSGGFTDVNKEARAYGLTVCGEE
jgi:hypothetical protein